MRREEAGRGRLPAIYTPLQTKSVCVNAAKLQERFVSIIYAGPILRYVHKFDADKRFSKKLSVVQIFTLKPIV